MTRLPISISDSVNQDLEKARRDLAADVEAFLAAGNGIEVIVNPSTKEVIEELGKQIRPLLSKTGKFKDIHIGST